MKVKVKEIEDKDTIIISIALIIGFLLILILPYAVIL